MDEGGTTAVLVLAARGGDAAAVRSLYVRFARVVHGVLLGYVQHADADDLTQDVFQTALQRLSELREPAAFPGWLLRIARNAALNRLRQARVVEIDAASMVDGSAGPDTRLEAQQALAAIRNLPEAYRETLMLRLVEGLSGPEISARTGLTPGTVRVNLHRGMGLLRRALGIGATREVEA
ncbi:MAG: sigma-70 family RNA polymerase sigma factor [Luteimonas sp.]